MMLIDTCKVATDRGDEIICLFSNGDVKRAVRSLDLDDWRYSPPTDWITLPTIPQGSPRKALILVGLQNHSFVVQCDDESLWQWFFGYSDWYPVDNPPWNPPA